MGVAEGALADLGKFLIVTASFWAGKRALLTGHTGFKGAWLSLWLKSLGAKVHGYALPPPTSPSLFATARVEEILDGHTLADIADVDRLGVAFRRFRPDVVFHLAAQSLVRESYLRPVDTYAVNVMGTVNVLEAARHSDSTRAVVIVTTDKCYENREMIWGYREHDPLGGHDPYSSSKACAELVTAAYARSFFGDRPCAVTSARAGNVIGGGDWSKDRLMADIMRGLIAGERIVIRNPGAIRPWQHVFEPLSGYLCIAERLMGRDRTGFESWNFGPDLDSERTVGELARLACRLWGRTDLLAINQDADAPHEATLLKLDSTKARIMLGWRPRWSFHEGLSRTVEWYRRYVDKEDARAFCLAQLASYEAAGDPQAHESKEIGYAS